MKRRLFFASASLLLLFSAACGSRHSDEYYEQMRRDSIRIVDSLMKSMGDTAKWKTDENKELLQPRHN